MGNIAQYITVFIANQTQDASATPDCFPSRKSSCNNITCTYPSTGDHFNYSFLVCQEPIAINIVHALADGTVLTGSVYSESQPIKLQGNDAQLTLNHLDKDMVQIEVQLI